MSAVTGNIAPRLRPSLGIHDVGRMVVGGINRVDGSSGVFYARAISAVDASGESIASVTWYAPTAAALWMPGDPPIEEPATCHGCGQPVPEDDSTALVSDKGVSHVRCSEAP